MSDRARHAVERFPDLAHAIKQYAADNRFFQSLCEDYGEAVEILRRLEETDRAGASVDACRELVADLEKEILLELQHWNDR